jgi:hypothetical protein
MILGQEKGTGLSCLYCGKDILQLGKEGKEEGREGGKEVNS